MKHKIVDIIIISYAKDDYHKELTKTCIDSLLASEDIAEDIFNVIVVESEPGVKWEHMSECISTYQAPVPYGYHKFLNFGRKKGNNKWVALCNNDLTFDRGWFLWIMAAHNENPDIISFSPLCPLTQPLYGINRDTGNIEGHTIRKHISGWCIVHKRSIYDDIGDLDEDFVHWFCDNDYGMTLMTKGIKHMLVTASVVTHHDKKIGKTTEHLIKDDKEMHRLTMGAQPIFLNKWIKYL